ncbi:MAG TPA: ATP-dependent helicase [Ktedonobacterales bacterium]
MNELAKAQAAAEQLLASYQTAFPDQIDPLAATPIDTIVAWQGVAVERFNPVDHPHGTLGWLEPGEDLIWLSMALDEPVRRFTLAHELGHWVLHRHAGTSISGPLSVAPALTAEGSAACTDDDVEVYLDGGWLEDEMLRPGQSYSPRAMRERAADAFAAALLAPLERVRALFLGTPDQAPLEPERLAEHFGITLKAMLGRLAELLHESPTGTATPTPVSAAPPTKSASSAAKPYDPWQQAAITAPTPALVVAGPGSGKTSTLVGRVRHLIEEQGLTSNQLLALTFSNKAAREMRERIAQLLGDEAALPTVSTFHSFCAELLRLYAAQVGLRPDFALLDTPDGYFLLRRQANRLPLRHYGHLGNPELHFAALLGAASRAKDELATPADYLRLAEEELARAQTDEQRLKAERAREVAQVYQVYQEALAAQGDADFGDLIMQTARFLSDNPTVLAELQERYQQILVDEFQDINRASGVLLKLLAGERANIWVVGDQDQAIYRFRGASPANIGQFHRDYPGAQVLPLSRNYRSLADIVAAAGAFREATLRFPNMGQQAEELFQPEEEQPEPEQREAAAPSAQASVSTRQEPVRQSPEEPVITLAVAPDDQSEVAGLVAAIQQSHARGVHYRDQVVLCRTREHARVFIEGLERAGLPVNAGGSLLEQPDVKDVLAIVALLAEPSGMGLLRAAAQPDHYIPHDDLLKLFDYARQESMPAGVLLWQPERLPQLSAQGFLGALHLADILLDLRTTPDIWTLLARYLFIHTHLAQQLLVAADSASHQRLEHLRGLLDLARRFDTQERERQATGQEEEAADKRWERFLEYVRVLIELRADSPSRREPEEGDGEAAEMIRVMTVHASKGLEFPVVYLPQLAQNRFPVTMKSERMPLPDGLCEDETLREKQDARAAHLLDEACLFYVGVTRARDELVLSYAERYKTRKAVASDFLQHIQAALGTRLRAVRWEGAALIGPKSADQQDEQPARLVEALRPAALSVTELETYLRCPRRYEYLYVYGLQPVEQGYRQFYESVQRVVRALHESFAASGVPSEQPKQAEADDTAAIPTLTLDDARDLFVDGWRQHGPLEHPFADIYFTHGLRVIERTWSDLAGVPLASEAEAPAGDEASAEGVTANKLAASSRLSQKLGVQLDGQRVEVTVDRVEDEQRLPFGEGQRPVRLVRHKLSGKDDEKPDVEVRHILYALAQEQRAPGRPVEVYEHNLSTGALTPVPLTSRAAQNRRADLAQALDGLRARRYPPKPDRFVCPRCPFVLICPAD